MIVAVVCVEWVWVLEELAISFVIGISSSL